MINKRNWLEEGFVILAAEGALALTIERLAQQLKLTKGSFYHHFKNMQNYKEELLAHFEAIGTLDIIALSETQSSPQAKLVVLLEKTTEDLPTLETAIRAWALQDPFVKQYQERIDTQRLHYLQQLIFTITNEPDQALLAARLIYSVFVGSYQISPPLMGEPLRQLYLELLKFYKLI